MWNFCISNEFPRNADGASPRTTLWVTRNLLENYVLLIRVPFVYLLWDRISLSWEMGLINIISIPGQNSVQTDPFHYAEIFCPLQKQKDESLRCSYLPWEIKHATLLSFSYKRIKEAIFKCLPNEKTLVEYNHYQLSRIQEMKIYYLVP